MQSAAPRGPQRQRGRHQQDGNPFIIVVAGRPVGVRDTSGGVIPLPPPRRLEDLFDDSDDEEWIPLDRLRRWPL
jgi:hypothetical protein